MKTMNDNNEASTTHGTHEKSVINIQLSYNPQAPTELDLWSDSFHFISLHKSIEHFTSDSKNIKDSLNFMAKYISNKQINNSKANLIAWIMLFGISPHQSMRLSGTFSLQAINLLLLDQKFLPSSSQKLHLTWIRITRKLPNWFLSLSKKLLLHSHFQLNPRMKSTLFQNIFKVASIWWNPRSWLNLTLRLQASISDVVDTSP